MASREWPASRSSVPDARQSAQRQVPTDLIPHTTLACQVQATNAWRQDLRSLLNEASERFADVSWSFGGDGSSSQEEDDDIDVYHQDQTISRQTRKTFKKRSTPSLASHADIDTPIVWAHKAILYARASNSFQARYLQLRTPAANLGAAFASTSTISLPVVQNRSPEAGHSLKATSRPSSSIRSVKSASSHSRIRGSAPPSSYTMNKNAGGKSSRSIVAESEDDEPLDRRREAMVKRTKSNLSTSSSSISRPFSRSDRQIHGQTSRQSISSASLTIPESNDSDSISVITSTSTVRGPMNLCDIDPTFFQASLEYIYTAEESVAEVFEFLHEDKAGSEEGVEKRLEKLRQDLVFMWRSRLYADIEIVLGESQLGTIPDSNASVFSFSMHDGGEEDTASFFAHRMLLASRSPYFAAQLLSPYADADSRIVRLPSPPFTPAAMHFTLGFIYTGTLFFSNRTFDLSTAFQLWLSGSYLQIETLQSLVSSLIAQDFCHGFACSPPCKTCVRRVPRTLTFVSRPDVSDVRLRAMAQSAISGEHFGSYWSKEVGNLEYAERGSIVAQVCEQIDQNPGFIITASRQLSIVGRRIDIERSTNWVESLRWMCESVQTYISSCISSKFGEMIASKEWRALMQEIAFMNDVLETLLTVLLQQLDEANAAKNYEVMVGNVLLQENHPPPANIVHLVEEARASVVKYVRKRWVNIRLLGGFNDLESWSLRELADEIDVPYGDLLLPDGDTTLIASSTTPFPRSGAGNESTKPWTTIRHASRLPAPGSMVDGEREAGPIHLRAAVLNRNAARVSASQGTQSGLSSSAPYPVQNRTPQTSASATRSSSNQSVSRQASESRSSTSSANLSTSPSSRRPSITSNHVSSVLQSRSLEGTSSDGRAPLAELSHSDPITAATPTAGSARRGVRKSEPEALGGVGAQSSSRSSVLSMAKQYATNVSARSKAGNDNAVQEQRLRKTLEAQSVTNAGANSSIAPAGSSRGTRGRLASTTSAKSAKSFDNGRSIPNRASQGQIRASAGRQGRPHESARPTNAIATSTSSADRRTTDKTTVSGTSATIVDSTATTGLTEGKDRVTQKTSMTLTYGTKLSLGIPCVIGPTTRTGKQARLKATVKYIGPLASDPTTLRSPVIGVEIALPLPADLDESSFDFHDGTFAGHEYFAIGSPRYTSEQIELDHKPEREARRRRIEQMIRSDATLDRTFSLDDAGNDTEATVVLDNKDARSVGLPTFASVKRRKDSAGLGHEQVMSPSSSKASLGLFIRPNEVLWVVV